MAYQSSPQPDSFDSRGDFADPVSSRGRRLSRLALPRSVVNQSRSLGSHYSSSGQFPSVAGADGVGRTADGQRVYFVLPEAPYGALAEKSLVRSEQCIAIPDGLDDVTAAAIANPGMSAWAALVERAHLAPGETVLVNGATGTAGRLAIQHKSILVREESSARDGTKVNSRNWRLWARML